MRISAPVNAADQAQPFLPIPAQPGYFNGFCHSIINFLVIWRQLPKRHGLHRSASHAALRHSAHAASHRMCVQIVRRFFDSRIVPDHPPDKSPPTISRFTQTYTSDFQSVQETKSQGKQPTNSGRSSALVLNAPALGNIHNQFSTASAAVDLKCRCNSLRPDFHQPTPPAIRAFQPTVPHRKRCPAAFVFVHRIFSHLRENNIKDSSSIYIEPTLSQYRTLQPLPVPFFALRLFLRLDFFRDFGFGIAPA